MKTCGFKRSSSCASNRPTATAFICLPSVSYMFESVNHKKLMHGSSTPVQERTHFMITLSTCMFMLTNMAGVRHSLAAALISTNTDAPAKTCSHHQHARQRVPLSAGCKPRKFRHIPSYPGVHRNLHIISRSIWYVSTLDIQMQHTKLTFSAVFVDQRWPMESEKQTTRASAVPRSPNTWGWLTACYTSKLVKPCPPIQRSWGSSMLSVTTCFSQQWTRDPKISWATHRDLLWPAPSESSA